MQFYWVHVTFTVTYILITTLTMLGFIFCSILWSYWHDLLGAPARGCIFFLTNIQKNRERFQFVGGKRLFCYLTIYGTLPFVAAAIWGIMTHLFYICHEKNKHNSEISIHMDKCAIYPKLEAIVCLLCSIFNYALAIFLLIAFLETCKTGTILSLGTCEPGLEILGYRPYNGTTCGTIIRSLDSCSRKYIRRDSVNSFGLMLSAIVLHFLSSTLWMVCFVTNLALYVFYEIEGFHLEY